MEGRLGWKRKKDTKDNRKREELDEDKGNMEWKGSRDGKERRT